MVHILILIVALIGVAAGPAARGANGSSSSTRVVTPTVTASPAPTGGTDVSPGGPLHK